MLQHALACVSMSSLGTRDDRPILICSQCRRPMDFLATLPEIANLPAVHAYMCLPCRRVETIDLGESRGFDGA